MITLNEKSESDDLKLGINKEFSSKDRIKTSDRITYEAEMNIIINQIGDLEDIRSRLGLSARKMAQLLMVDPSAWSRWVNKVTPVPPHIYRSLQWYLILQEKNPGFTPQIFLANRWHYSNTVKKDDLTAFLTQIEYLKMKIKDLEFSLATQSNQKKALQLKGFKEIFFCFFKRFL